MGANSVAQYAIRHLRAMYPSHRGFADAEQLAAYGKLLLATCLDLGIQDARVFDQAMEIMRDQGAKFFPSIPELAKALETAQLRSSGMSDASTAFKEACSQSGKLEARHRQYSNLATEVAAQRTGIADLRNCTNFTQQALSNEFAMHYRDCCREYLAGKLTKPKAITEASTATKKINKAFALDQLNKIKGILK